MTTSPAWSIVEYRGRAGLLQLEDEWRRLYAAMPLRTSYHAFEAHLAYVDYLMAAPDELRCLALHDGRQTRAICPLEPRVDRTLGLPVPVWGMPAPPHLPLPDIVCPEDEARRESIPALTAWMRRDHGGRRLLILGPLPASSVLWDGLQRLDGGLSCTDTAGGMHVIDCAGSFDELFAGLSKNSRRMLKRARKKLALLEDVRFVSAPGEADLATELETFLDVEASGWKGASGTRTAISLRGNQPDFFRSLLPTRNGKDHFEIDALYAEGRCIASQLCARTGSEYAGLKIGYDEHYSRFTPGQLLCERIIERCCQDPDIRRFNFLSEAAWHLAWRPDLIELQRAYVALDPWFGRALIALLRLRFGPGRRFVRWTRNEWERRQAERARSTPTP